MILFTALADEALKLLALAVRIIVPYVAGGGNLNGMDCQGLIEYLMGQCGLIRNWRGSNDMWRNALKWAGTPEAFCERFGDITGGAVPQGAGVFIVEGDGGEPDEYKRTDEARFGGSKGNASHVGLYMGGGRVLHASSSMGRVCESVKFDGRNAVQGGGWNMVGLWADVDYGAELEAAIAADGEAPDNADGASPAPTDEGAVPCDVPVSYAHVFAANGKPVKLRPQTEKGELYWEVASGIRVEVERRQRGWALIRAVCTDGVLRRAWMMEDYLRHEGQPTGATVRTTA